MKVPWFCALFTLASLVSSAGCDDTDTEGESTGAGGDTTSTSSSAGGMGGAGGGPCAPLDDGNPCTDDVCENNLPVHKPNAACVDCIGPADCPGSDDECKTRTCEVGACGFAFTPANTPVAAQTPNDCQKAVCDGSGDVSSIADDTDTPLDDGNLCTGEACSAGAPSHPVAPDGAACTDGDACTQSDTCQAGLCTGADPVVCSALDQCHAAGACDPLTGTCSNPNQPNGFACDDGDQCTGPGACQMGVCELGAPLCMAGAPVDECHVQTGACDAGTGACATGALPAGTTCGADLVCTANGDCVPHVVLNEVESSGGSPGDWVELYNAGPAVDLTGWVFKDNNDALGFVIPAGTTLASGAYLVLEEATFGFGLGSADSARLFDPQGTLVDSYTWATHATITYGRCPDGTGAFATTSSSTKGAANMCGGGPPPAPPWPGGNAVTTVDGVNAFGVNLSGLFYEPAAVGTNVLWAVRNNPSTVFRLLYDGSIWAPDPANGWGAGKTIRYPSGMGGPDSEDLTKAELSSSAIYVVTERDNTVSGVSRISILRYDTDQPAAELTATHEWNLTADLPVVGPNIGPEAMTWIPDAFLVASSFFDETAGHTYVPAEYPDHGTGLFFVGLEANGAIYAYALDHAGGGFSRIATITGGDATIKALYFDRDVGYLWSHCGASCSNKHTVMVIDSSVGSPTFGKLKVTAEFARPGTMPNIANEGMAIAPESECVNGFKGFLWADDSETGGHAIRLDSIPCGAFIP